MKRNKPVVWILFTVTSVAFAALLLARQSPVLAERAVNVAAHGSSRVSTVPRMAQATPVSTGEQESFSTQSHGFAPTSKSASSRHSHRSSPKRKIVSENVLLERASYKLPRAVATNLQELFQCEDAALVECKLVEVEESADMVKLVVTAEQITQQAIERFIEIVFPAPPVDQPASTNRSRPLMQPQQPQSQQPFPNSNQLNSGAETLPNRISPPVKQPNSTGPVTPPAFPRPSTDSSPANPAPKSSPPGDKPGSR